MRVFVLSRVEFQDNVVEFIWLVGTKDSLKLFDVDAEQESSCSLYIGLVCTFLNVLEGLEFYIEGMWYFPGGNGIGLLTAILLWTACRYISHDF